MSCSKVDVLQDAVCRSWNFAQLWGALGLYCARRRSGHSDTGLWGFQVVLLVQACLLVS